MNDTQIEVFFNQAIHSFIYCNPCMLYDDNDSTKKDSFVIRNMDLWLLLLQIVIYNKRE